MSLADEKLSTSSADTYLLVPIFSLFVLLVIAVLRGPHLISSAGIGSAVIVVTPLILATYALTVIAMAGRVGVDLSIGPMIGFLNVSMIQLFAAGVITTPVHFFSYAIIAGVAYQLLMGLIIVYVRVQPIIVALSGYLAFVGLNLVILTRPGGVVPDWLKPWGLGESVFSPVLAILVLATLAWFILTRTAFFGHLRLMGSDERTAYTSGVRIGIVRLGAHVIAGVYTAVAAITFTSLIGSGDPTQGSTYTLMAVTALVLGGTSLAGGRGSIIGSLLGALNIYLITFVLSTFNFGMVQSFVTDVAYGVVLVISLLLTLILPRLPARIKGVSPIAFFVVLGVIAVGVILHAEDEIVVPASALQSSSLSVPGDAGSAGDAGVKALGSDSSGDSGVTVLGAEPRPASPPANEGTALILTAVIIAIVLYLLYLLYRHVSVSLVTFIGVLILLVLGVTLYHRTGPAIPAPAFTARVSSGSVNVQPLNFFYYEVIDTGVRSATTSVFGIDASVFTSPFANGVLIFVGAILVGTLLIVVAVRGGTKVRDAHLVFYLALAAAIVSVIVYASDGYRLSSALFSGEAFTAIVVGALLFFVTLPKVQSRVKNFFLVMLTMLSAIVLGVMYFAGGSGGTMATSGAHPQSGAEIISRVPLPPGISGNFQNVNLAPEFYVEVFWLMLATAVIFLVALPRVWAWVTTYLSFDQGVKALSYTGVFIVAFSIAMMAALFYAVNVPLWRFGVAVVAAIIGVRFLWRFLRNYRKIDTQGSELRNNGESESARDMIGAGR